MAKRTKAVLGTDRLDVVADRGYFNGEEIPACDKAGTSQTNRQTRRSTPINHPGPPHRQNTKRFYTASALRRT
jgi:hypothetical protein